MAGICEYNGQEFECSRHIVFLHRGCCARAKSHHLKMSACYGMSNRVSELVSSSEVGNHKEYSVPIKIRNFLLR
jgi:hypothetical protein